MPDHVTPAAHPKPASAAPLWNSETAKAASAKGVEARRKAVSFKRAIRRHCRHYPFDLADAAAAIVKTAADPDHRHWPDAIQALSLALDGLPGKPSAKATGGLRLTFSDLQAMATGAAQVSAQVSMPLDVTAIGQAMPAASAGGPLGAGEGPDASSGPVNDHRAGARLPGDLDTHTQSPGVSVVGQESQASPEPVVASTSSPESVEPVDPVEEGKT